MICISVCAKTAYEFIEKIKLAAEKVDIVELRFDCLAEKEFEIALQEVSELKSSKSFLATLRPEKEAEFIFSKIIYESKEESNKRVSERNKRISNWKKILILKNIKFIDIENDLFLLWFTEKTFNYMEKELSETLNNHRLILSEHNFIEVPENLNQIFESFIPDEGDAIQSNIIKIAVQANDICDTIPVWKLLKRAKSENKEIIPIAMGEAGKWTRILGLAHGAFLTFAALDKESATAPGQITIEDMIDVYRVKELDEKTEIYGILGNNTSVSMSPYMHNAAFKFHGLNAVFVPLQTENLDQFICRMVKKETREIELNFKGFSVTIPHKQNIIKHLDSIDETAEKIGAVNTVKIDNNGKLHGFNTDANGFIEPLLNSYGDLNGVKVAIFGAGGAARACIYALKQAGANITIFARNIEKAVILAKEFDVEAKEPVTDRSPFTGFEIIVNATPLGMKGKFEGETPLVADRMKDANLVYDLVYNPFETQFLREADKVHVPKIGGLAMLVAQAMAQQKIWTGKDAPMKEMSAAILNRLK